MHNQKQLSKCHLAACLMAILLNIAATGWFIDPSTPEWRIFNLVDTMVRGSVPLFFMISGTLLLKKKTLDNKIFFKKTILHLAVLYAVWSVLYELIECLSKSQFSLSAFLLAVCKGHYHLWLISAMIIVFMFTPVIHHALHGQKITPLYLLLLFGTMTLLTENAQLLPGLPGVAKALLEKLDLKYIPYAGYMVWGYILSRKQFGRKVKIASAAAYIILGLLTAALNRWYSISHGYACSWLYGYFSIPTFIQATAIFTYFTSSWSGEKNSCDTPHKAKKYHFLPELSTCAFGVYLFHPMVFETLTKLGLDVKTGNPAYMIPITFISTTLICFCIIIPARKIKAALHKRFEPTLTRLTFKDKPRYIKPAGIVVSIILILFVFMPVTRISFSTDNVKSINAGAKQALSIRIPPWNIFNKNIVWSSSNPSAATVDENGVVTALCPIESVDITAASADERNVTCTWNLKITLEDGYIKDSTLDDLDLSSTNKVMFVAHPDDESLWGGAHLLQDDYLVVCMTHGWNEARKSAFIETMQKTNDKYIILNYPDTRKQFADGTYETDTFSTCRTALQKDIEKVLSYKKWEQVVTHNPDGEYDKYHHQQISKLVTKGFNKYYKDNSGLWYFGRYYNQGKIPGKQITPSLLDTKKQLVQRYYGTASGAFLAFGHMIPYENWVQASDW